MKYQGVGSACGNDVQAARFHPAVEGKGVVAAAKVDFIVRPDNFAVNGHAVITGAGGDDVFATVIGLHGDALTVVGGEDDAVARVACLGVAGDVVYRAVAFGPQGNGFFSGMGGCPMVAPMW